MSVGEVITGIFAILFTLGALALPFAIQGWMRGQSPARKVAGAMYCLFGTMGLAIMAACATGLFLSLIGVTVSTFWITFMCQALLVAANLFFWIPRGARH